MKERFIPHILKILLITAFLTSCGTSGESSTSKFIETAPTLVSSLTDIQTEFTGEPTDMPSTESVTEETVVPTTDAPTTPTAEPATLAPTNPASEPVTEAPTEPAATSPTQAPTPENSAQGGSNNFNTYDNKSQQNTEGSWVLNKNTMKIHYPSCSSVAKIKPENYATSNKTLEELLSQGYSRCGICLK